MAGKSAEEIVALYQARQAERSPMFSAMREIIEVYNGDFVVPLPEMDNFERSYVANVISLGVDQHAMRVSSVMPDPFFYPVVPGDPKHEERARTKRRAVLGWWEENKLPLKMKRRARWLVGLGQAPVFLRPNPQWGMPEWVLRHPLSTFPSPSEDPDDMCPNNVLFASSRPFHSLRDVFPAVEALHRSHPRSDDQRVTMIEYIDEDEYVTVAVGHDVGPNDPRPHGVPCVEMVRTPNKAGICLGVVPGRVTLDRLAGMFDQSIGSYQMRSKLMSLEIQAAERGIHPDVWVVSQGSTPAKIIQTPDWRQGRPGVITGGMIDKVEINPSFASLQNVDRLERNEKVSAGIPAAFGGESGPNMRTARGVDTVMSASVDHHTHEMQTIFAHSLKEENRRAIAVQKAYFSGKRSFFVGWKGESGRVDYDPAEVFDSDAHVVRYAFPGTDLGGLSIRLGQKLGTGQISLQTSRELDPEIQDAELEHDRTVGESLERALLLSIEARAQSGEIAEVDVARIVHLVKTNKKELAEAVEQVQREAQERQAKHVEPSAPEAMPGLANPGVGAESIPTIPPPERSLQHLSSLFSSLRRPAMRLPEERSA